LVFVVVVVVVVVVVELIDLHVFRKKKMAKPVQY
jgi:hypothetical protein